MLRTYKNNCIELSSHAVQHRASTNECSRVGSCTRTGVHGMRYVDACRRLEASAAELIVRYGQPCLRLSRSDRNSTPAAAKDSGVATTNSTTYITHDATDVTMHQLWYLSLMRFSAWESNFPAMICFLAGPRSPHGYTFTNVKPTETTRL
jgi:hypothetical protein